MKSIKTLYEQKLNKYRNNTKFLKDDDFNKKKTSDCFLHKCYFF